MPRRMTVPGARQGASGVSTQGSKASPSMAPGMIQGGRSAHRRPGPPQRSGCASGRTGSSRGGARPWGRARAGASGRSGPRSRRETPTGAGVLASSVACGPSPGAGAAPRPCRAPPRSALFLYEMAARRSARCKEESRTLAPCASARAPASSLSVMSGSARTISSRSALRGASLPAVPGARPCGLGATWPRTRCCRSQPHRRARRDPEHPRRRPAGLARLHMGQEALAQGHQGGLAHDPTSQGK